MTVCEWSGSGSWECKGMFVCEWSGSWECKGMFVCGWSGIWSVGVSYLCVSGMLVGSIRV